MAFGCSLGEIGRTPRIMIARERWDDKSGGTL